MDKYMAQKVERRAEAHLNLAEQYDTEQESPMFQYHNGFADGLLHALYLLDKEKT